MKHLTTLVAALVWTAAIGWGAAGGGGGVGGEMPGGSGLPDGGTTGQVLVKASDDDGDAEWDTVSGTGDVVGPASAVDDEVALFDSTTGKLLKNSGVTIDEFVVATSAADDPDENDDTDNFAIGDIWKNTTTGTYFIATDVTDGAAVWLTILPTADTYDETTWDGNPETLQKAAFRDVVVALESSIAANADEVAAHEIRLDDIETDPIASTRISQVFETLTGTITLDADDNGKVFWCDGSSPFSLSLPVVAASITYSFANIDTNAVTIDAPSGTLSDLEGGTPSSLALERGDRMFFVSLGSGDWRMFRSDHEKLLGQFLIEEPTGSEDLTLTRLRADTTITYLATVLTGSVTSVTFDVRHGSDRSAAGTALVTTPAASTSTTTGTNLASFDNPAADADDWLWVTTTAVAGDTGTAYIGVWGYDN